MKFFLWIMASFIQFAGIAQELVFNDETTDIQFTIHHIMGKVKGSFKGVNGTAFLDSSRLGLSYLNLSFNASTANLSDNVIVPNLFKEACLDANRYPAIGLMSTSIDTLPGTGRYQFHGLLTVKNISRNITFPFSAKPNIGGYDFLFSFPLSKKEFNLQCAFKKKFDITVRGYGKRRIKVE